MKYGDLYIFAIHAKLDSKSSQMGYNVQVIELICPTLGHVPMSFI